MKIRIVMDMAYDEPTIEEACKSVAKRYGVLVEIVERASDAGGWPRVALTGGVEKILALLQNTNDNVGWATGDAGQDAEQVYYAMRGAVEVYG